MYINKTSIHTKEWVYSQNLQYNILNIIKIVLS